MPSLYLYYKALWDPYIPFLPNKNGAEWICYKLPSSLMVRNSDYTNQSTRFLRSFHLEKVSHNTKIEIKACTDFQLRVNGRLLKRIKPGTNWKEPFSIPISSVLKKGKNRIEIVVTNKRGPPVLWAVLYNLPVNLGTDPKWEAETGSMPRVPAGLVVSKLDRPENYPYKRLPKSHSRVWVKVALFFLLGSILCWFWDLARRKNNSLKINPKKVILVTLSASIGWIFLFVNNNFKYPHLAGFDLVEHLYYMQFVINKQSLPYATEGWSTYHPPLFYLCSAFIEMLNPRQMTFKLKFIPFLAGLGNVLLAYLLSKNIFPKHFPKQSLIVLFAAIAPVNIYLSHFFTNEGLAGFMMSALLVATVIQLGRPVQQKRNLLLMGVLAGLALLTKYTSIVLFISILFIILLKTTTSPKWSRKRVYTSLLIFIGATVGMAGWYYLRNYLAFGTLFPGNWDNRLGYAWWQDPGVHTTAYYTQFGGVFTNPFFIGINSYFDSIFATFWGDTMASGAIVLDQGLPWNLEYMHAIMILSIPATIMIMVGFLQANKKAIVENNDTWCLLVIYPVFMFYFILYASLVVPAYSVSKAIFGIGALLPLCIFFAIGFESADRFFKRRFYNIRFCLYGWLVALTGAIVNLHFMTA